MQLLVRPKALLRHQTSSITAVGWRYWKLASQEIEEGAPSRAVVIVPDRDSHKEYEDAEKLGIPQGCQAGLLRHARLNVLERRLDPRLNGGGKVIGWPGFVEQASIQGPKSLDHGLESLADEGGLPGDDLTV